MRIFYDKPLEGPDSQTYTVTLKAESTGCQIAAPNLVYQVHYINPCKDYPPKIDTDNRLKEIPEVTTHVEKLDKDFDLTWKRGDESLCGKIITEVYDFTNGSEEELDPDLVEQRLDTNDIRLRFRAQSYS